MKALQNFAKFSFRFFLITLFVISASQANAETLIKGTALSRLDATDSLEETNGKTLGYEIKCEGSYLIKDGELDEIYKLKFVLPKIKLKSSVADNLIDEKQITFEQTHVMVLPIMGMVHFVGNLTIGDVTTKGSFQLAFNVNDDQSITFKGGKAIRLIEFYPNAKIKLVDELSLDINFVLKNSKNNLAVASAE